MTTKEKETFQHNSQIMMNIVLAPTKPVVVYCEKHGNVWNLCPICNPK